MHPVTRDLQSESEAPEWTEPGPQLVASGVHRIPLPLPMDGLRAVNVYAIETEQGLTLIDGGWAIDESRRHLESSLAAIGHRLSDITRVLVTHAHRDHYTQAIAIRRELGCRVTLGLGDQQSLRLVQKGRLEPDTNVLQLLRSGAYELADAWTRLTSSQPLAVDNFDEPDEWLVEDQQISIGSRTLAAVATPGHTQGHFVFADLTADLFFAGDHVLPSITPSIGFEPAKAELPLRDFLGSLAKVRTMPDMALLPAHGAVAASSHRRIDELTAHHHDRLCRCLSAVSQGATTAYEVASELRWTRHERHLNELDPFNATLATLETLAHVELLTAQGRIEGRVDGHVMIYRPLSNRTG